MRNRRKKRGSGRGLSVTAALPQALAEHIEKVRAKYPDPPFVDIGHRQTVDEAVEFDAATCEKGCKYYVRAATPQECKEFQATPPLSGRLIVSVTEVGPGVRVRQPLFFSLESHADQR